MRPFILFLLLTLATNIYGQTLTVKNKITHRPLAHVSVYSISANVADVTDERGHADLSGFEKSDSIRVELIGYRPGIYTLDKFEKLNFVLFLEETSITLDGIVVSAVRWGQSAREVPAKISAIRPTEIRIQNPQTTADMLAVSGEVLIQKSQLGGGSPLIRGFATNRVLISVDGVRMNTAIFRSGNLQNVISLDAFATQSAEILFGPGSVIYGSDAIGGVMAFQSLSPRFSDNGKPLFQGSVTSRVSSANYEKTAHGDFNIGLQKWAFLTSLTATDFDDLKMGGHGPTEYLRNEFQERVDGRDVVRPNPDNKTQRASGYSQLNFLQSIRYAPTDNLDFSYALHYSKSGDVPRYDRLIQYRDGQLRSGDWYYGPQKWLMNVFNVKYSANSSFYDNAHLTLASQLFEESRHSRNFGDAILKHRTEKVHALSLNFDFEKKIGVRKQLFYGVELVHNYVGSNAEQENIENGQVAPLSARYPDGSTWRSYAAYLSLNHKVTEKISLQGGLRYNHIKLKSDFDTQFFPFPFTSAQLNTGAIVGNVGIVLNPTDDWNLSANLSSGFRAPNIDDIGKVFDSEPGSIVVPNPGLKPEYAYNGEIGAAKIFQGVAKIDFSAYYTFLDNALVRRNFSLNGQDSVLYEGVLSQAQAIQNASQAIVAGVQAGVELKLPVGMTLVSRINLQNGEEELENGETTPLRHAGPWFGSTHLNFRYNRIRTDFYAVYNGEVLFRNLAPEERSKPYIYAIDGNGNPFSPAWHTLNFKGIYQFTDNMQLSMGIENIADRRYRPYSSGIVAPGRNFILAFKADF